jgi:hypothetical protein
MDETNRVLTHDFWLEVAAFVSFCLAAGGVPLPWPKVSPGWLGAALIALALLW